VDPALFLRLLFDPRVGLPILCLASAGAIWLLFAPRGRPRTTGFDPAVPVPDRDPVSRTVVALHEEAYSQILLEAYDRLDASLRRHRGIALEEVDRPAPPGAGLPRPERRELRRLASDLTQLQLHALRLETGSRLRWDFWRSLESSRRWFFRRLDALLGQVDRRLTLLARAP
jgi:hypothetical protein